MFNVQPSVGANHVSSDESSTEGATSYSANSVAVGQPNLQVPDALSAPISFEPIPLSIPQLSPLPKVPVVPQQQQATVMSQSTVQQMLMTTVQSQNNSNFSNGFASMTPSRTSVPLSAQAIAVPPTNKSAAAGARDEILDEAVDALFADDPLMNETETLDGLWDTTSAFGDETNVVSLQDDIQLGFMLEKILEA